MTFFFLSKTQQQNFVSFRSFPFSCVQIWVVYEIKLCQIKCLKMTFSWNNKHQTVYVSTIFFCLRTRMLQKLINQHGVHETDQSRQVIQTDPWWRQTGRRVTFQQSSLFTAITQTSQRNSRLTETLQFKGFLRQVPAVQQHLKRAPKFTSWSASGGWGGGERRPFLTVCSRTQRRLLCIGFSIISRYISHSPNASSFSVWKWIFPETNGLSSSQRNINAPPPPPPQISSLFNCNKSPLLLDRLTDFTFLQQEGCHRVKKKQTFKLGKCWIKCNQTWCKDNRPINRLRLLGAGSGGGEGGAWMQLLDGGVMKAWGAAGGTGGGEARVEFHHRHLWHFKRIPRKSREQEETQEEGGWEEVGGAKTHPLRIHPEKLQPGSTSSRSEHDRTNRRPLRRKEARATVEF